MQRIIAVLYVTLLFTVSAAVHVALADATPHAPVPGAPRAPLRASAGAPPPLPMKEEARLVTSVRYEALSVDSAVDSAMEARPAVLGADRPGPVAVSAAPARFNLDSEVYNRRGLWQTEWSRGRVERIDSGPVPRQSVLLPIVMYHHVQPIDFSQTNAFVSDLTLPPAEFERQIRYLKDRGFQSPSLEDLALCLQGRKDLPRLSVVLTFDDGYLDNYLYAFPLLARYGFSGTFFIITGAVGQKDYMAWWQVREIATAGMEIGSHTISHPDLAISSPAQREKELAESKKVLQDTLGKAVRVLSYPSGAQNPDVVAAARKAGYVAAVTTRYGATQDGSKLLELPRVRVHGTDTLPGFRWRIEQLLPAGDPETK